MESFKEAIMQAIGITMVVLCILCSGSVTWADPGSERAAQQLLSEMGMEDAFQRSIDQMLDVQIERNPGMAPFREVMRAFFQKYMSYKDLKPEMIRMYAEAFTKEELEEIRAFYATPTGQKTIRLMPELMARGAQIGSRRVRENIGELEAMIRQETERLQKQSAAQPSSR